METSLSKAQSASRENRLSMHLGSFDALISFLVNHNVQEVCIKSLVSPTASLRGDSVRHWGVCVTACLFDQPGTPIVYATFLAGSGAWGGKHSRLLYPVEVSDPLRLKPVQVALVQLQNGLFEVIEQALLDVSSFSVILDAQWDVPDAWSGIAKGFLWQENVWQYRPSSPSSVFTVW